jgi:hypothetical protein
MASNSSTGPNNDEMYLQQRVADLTANLAAETASHVATQVRLTNAENRLSNAENRLQNSLRNFARQKRDAERRIKGLEEELAKTKSGCDPSNEHYKLREQIVFLKNDIQFREKELQRFREINGRLSRQLQAEKANTATHFGTFSSNNWKLGAEGDDDEPLPGYGNLPGSEMQNTGTNNRPTFRQPYQIPEDLFKFKQEESKPDIKEEPRPKGTRKRSRVDEAGLELKDLDIGSTEELPPRKKKAAVHSRLRSKKSKATRQLNLDGNEVPFEFTAICKYDAKGNSDFFTSEDLKNTVGELWDRIEICARTIWTREFGELWQDVFQDPSYYPSSPVCVSQKCQGKRTKWQHRGFEGYYACRDCVEHGRPCFIYSLKQHYADDEEKGIFQLLPLHEKDRLTPVTDKFEIRYWVNDNQKMVDVDAEMDDDYED